MRSSPDSALIEDISLRGGRDRANAAVTSAARRARDPVARRSVSSAATSVSGQRHVGRALAALGDELVRGVARDRRAVASPRRSPRRSSHRAGPRARRSARAIRRSTFATSRLRRIRRSTFATSRLRRIRRSTFATSRLRRIRRSTFATSRLRRNPSAPSRERSPSATRTAVRSSVSPAANASRRPLARASTFALRELVLPAASSASHKRANCIAV